MKKIILTIVITIIILTIASSCKKDTKEITVQTSQKEVSTEERTSEKKEQAVEKTSENKEQAKVEKTSEKKDTVKEEKNNEKRLIMKPYKEDLKAFTNTEVIPYKLEETTIVYDEEERPYLEDGNLDLEKYFEWTNISLDDFISIDNDELKTINGIDKNEYFNKKLGIDNFVEDWYISIDNEMVESPLIDFKDKLIKILNNEQIIITDIEARIFYDSNRMEGKERKVFAENIDFLEPDTSLSWSLNERGICLHIDSVNEEASTRVKKEVNPIIQDILAGLYLKEEYPRIGDSYLEENIPWLIEDFDNYKVLELTSNQYSKLLSKMSEFSRVNYIRLERDDNRVGSIYTGFIRASLHLQTKGREYWIRSDYRYGEGVDSDKGNVYRINDL